ncbi:diguanylate cyclase [Thalassotalea sp. 1_MG-2023]|uniref:GGDEF domain-containing response regulator n=1 Tax=Thalassotalea sp. 1_MG-2023 TaxID=3062680 RepID=UPI0026E394AA|nr:diguanylate cyclase [Thalassotalea sp. 1_MG-2023]MDO6425397.1 diguanylate cyclase [Thalassotalea sp. 1_MG-2023]
MTDQYLDTNRRATDKQFTLLCIDDESANLKILASIFKDTYKVVVCKQPTQALAIALDVLPDLILLDVVMPDINGFELYEQFKEQPEVKHIPIIFITGLQSAEDEEKGLVLGACDYIQKPFNYGIVRVRVNTHMEIIRQRKLLESFAHIDSLTELPNRRKWQEDSANQWEFAKANNKRLVLGIVDIDFFKKYNDSYGHQQGDIVLRKVANAIRRVLFEHDGAIYRCGGEEFYFYFPSEKRTNIEEILAQCLEAVSGLEIQHQSSLASSILTASLGAVEVQPNDAHSVDSMLAIADEKLYRVKNTTRNAVHFSQIP